MRRDIVSVDGELTEGWVLEDSDSLFDIPADIALIPAEIRDEVLAAAAANRAEREDGARETARIAAELLDTDW